MANTFGSTTANDEGDWTNNKEMNPAANSSVTENGLLESEDQDGEKSWRATDEDQDSATENSTGAAGKSPASQNTTEEPGRTPGTAEGDVDADKYGNNS